MKQGSFFKKNSQYILPKIDNFQGTIFRLANNWFNFVPQTDSPIQYLEIGAFHGANAISVNNTYAKHPVSYTHLTLPTKRIV